MFVIGEIEDSDARRISDRLRGHEPLSLEGSDDERSSWACQVYREDGDALTAGLLRRFVSAARGDGVTMMMFDAHGEELTRVADVRVGDVRSEIYFPDGSVLAFLAGDRTLDAGEALLEPISLNEYEAIEALLALLWTAAADDRLSAVQERKVLTIAEMIADERLATTPDETERYGLVAVVRHGVRGFMSGDDVLKNALAWTQAAEIFGRIGWHTIEALARSVGG